MRRNVDIANCDLCNVCTDEGADVLAVSVRFEDRAQGSAFKRFLTYSFNHKESMPKERRRAVTGFVDEKVVGGESTNSGLVALDACFGCLTTRSLFDVMNYSATNPKDTDDS